MLITSIIQTLIFFLVFAFGLLLPGFVITCFLRLKVSLSALESWLYSLAFGLGLVDALYLILNRLQVALSRGHVISLYIVLLVLGLGALWRIQNKGRPVLPHVPLFTSKRVFLLALLIFAFSLFIKTWYLSETVLPTATDLGHHVFWSKLIADQERLPVYEKQEVLASTDGTYALSSPEPIADFIIGEHIPLAFLQKMTGIPFTTALPVAFLFCVNLASLLALALLAWRLFETFDPFESQYLKSEHVFVLALFFFGPIFTLASPEAKFVSGGVVGNILGNFLVPLILLTLIRALGEKSVPLLTASLALIATLVYTHHLSMFIFLFIAAGFIVTSALFLNRTFLQHFLSWWKLLFKPAPLLFLAALGLFIIFVGLPSYLQINAVTTAVGTPTKTSRTGLTFTQISEPNGVLRTGAALFGLLLILVSARLRKNYAGILLFGWTGILFIATLHPEWLFIDIPSNRVSYYISYPIGLTALFALSWVTEKLIRQAPELPLLQRPFTWLLGILFFTTLVVQGAADNESTLSQSNKGQAVAETFQASQYLADHTSATDLILKDHNFIAASDTWMKIFFNRGYAYPLSRSNFSRYDNPDHEQCTLDMISTPNTAFGKQCFDQLGVKYLVVNPRYDSAQFIKSDRFSLVYASPGINVFYRNQ